MCVNEKVSGMFLERLKPALALELLTMFRDARIPVVLLGGEPPPAGFFCDIAGINYLSRTRRTRVNFASPVARSDNRLLCHAELFGDVAVRLMLQRLAYSAKHPPAEVYIDILKPKPDRKGKAK